MMLYMWMIFSMSYKIMKTEWYKLNIGNKKITYRKTVDGLFCTFSIKQSYPNGVEPTIFPPKL